MYQRSVAPGLDATGPEDVISGGRRLVTFHVKENPELGGVTVSAVENQTADLDARYLSVFSIDFYLCKGS